MPPLRGGGGDSVFDVNPKQNQIRGGVFTSRIKHLAETNTGQILSVKCPKMHNLHKTTLDSMDSFIYTCDYCGTKIPHCRIECRTCNFDVCTVCYIRLKNGEQLPLFYSSLDPESIPARYICPLTQTIFHEPVRNVQSEVVYEKFAILLWIQSGRPYDPKKPECGIASSYLQEQCELVDEICVFVEATKHQSKIESFNVDSREWDKIFAAFDQSAKHDANAIEQQQITLKKTSQQLLRAETDEKENKDDSEKIAFCRNIGLQFDRPIVTIMGPARHGKSTLINDLLGVEDACPVSRKANQSFTKGAWIVLCESDMKTDEDDEGDGQVMDTMNEQEDAKQAEKQQSFYLIDMEGCSTGCTPLTRKLFYICYALSNVVIWNDKDIANDNFRKFMSEFEQEMNKVKTTEQKPTFLYLERDAGDYEYAPYETLNEYIKQDSSFQWLRDLGIFADVNGYELDRRPGRTKKPFSKEVLNDLTSTISSLCTNATAFIQNEQELLTQVEYVNQNTALSVGIQYINNNGVLRRIFCAKKGNLLTRKHHMTLAAIHWKWDHEKINRRFQKQRAKIEVLQQTKLVDAALITALDANAKELYERVKNKVDNTKRIKDEHRLIDWLPSTEADDRFNDSFLGSLRYTYGRFVVALLAEDRTEQRNTLKAAKTNWELQEKLELRYELGPTDEEMNGTHVK